MLKTIAVIAFASMFSVAIAVAQTSSSPESTAGGAAGTSKQGSEKSVKAKKTSGGGGSPESTAGGATGTSKNPKKKN